MEVNEVCTVRRNGKLVAYAMLRPEAGACWFVGAFGTHPLHRRMHPNVGHQKRTLHRLKVRFLEAGVTGQGRSEPIASGRGGHEQPLDICG